MRVEAGSCVRGFTQISTNPNEEDGTLRPAVGYACDCGVDFCQKTQETLTEVWSFAPDETTSIVMRRNRHREPNYGHELQFYNAFCAAEE